MGTFSSWLAETFGGSRRAATIELAASPYSAPKALDIERLAIATAAGYIASAVAQCDFRVFSDEEEMKTAEWWLWNVAPNKNQNSTQFITAVVEALIYNGEALVFTGADGGLFLAETYDHVKNGEYEDAFLGVRCADSRTSHDLRASDVLFFQLSRQNIVPLLREVCGEYADLIERAVNSYAKGMSDKGILSIDSVRTGAIDMESTMNDLLNNKFKKFFAAENAVLPLYRGFDYTPQTKNVRNVSEMTDVVGLTAEVVNRVAQAFRIPPALLRGETAGIAELREAFIAYSVQPIVNQIEEEINRKRYSSAAVCRYGTRIKIDASCISFGNIWSAAGAADKLIAAGVYSVNEIRERVGEAPLADESADTHWMTKNYQPVENALLEEVTTNENSIPPESE